MSLSAMKTTENLSGYRAAAMIILRELDEQEPKRPSPRFQPNTKSANYRAGYYDGLLMAHCILVLGEYPSHPPNKEQIRKALHHAKPQNRRKPEPPQE